MNQESSPESGGGRRQRPVTAEFIEALSAAVGAEDLLLAEEEKTPYGRDETEDLHFPPDVVVRPRQAETVGRVLSLCNQHQVPVTVRGGGTGLSGGALPVRGGLILSTEKLDRILDLDEQNMTAFVESGVVTQTLQEAAEARGLFYPPDPSSRGSCFIGGNIAHNAAGPRSLKYGPTRDYVLSLEGYLPSGTPLVTGSRTRKNSTGYDLTRLLVGSEGTLAVVTRACLRLLPLPAARIVLYATFRTLPPLFDALLEILRRCPAVCAAEFMEREAMEAAEALLKSRFPHRGEGSLLLELDGQEEAPLMREAETIYEIVKAHGTHDLVVADSPAKQKGIWNLRRAVGEAVKKISPYKEVDCVVPRRHLSDLYRAICAVRASSGLRMIAYGHAGDGNLHVNILREDLPENVWREKLPRAEEELLQEVVALGGTISGEHGVGYVQRKYLPLAYGETELRLMRAIKKAFDPEGLLNPDKIFP